MHLRNDEGIVIGEKVVGVEMIERHRVRSRFGEDEIAVTKDGCKLVGFRFEQDVVSKFINEPLLVSGGAACLELARGMREYLLPGRP